MMGFVRRMELYSWLIPVSFQPHLRDGPNRKLSTKLMKQYMTVLELKQEFMKPY